MTPQELKNSILQLAIQGKLVEQRPEEGTAQELYAQIQAEKQRLIQSGKLKKEKPLPEITEDEKPFEIPEGWMWVRLSQIWGVINGDRGKNYPSKSKLSNTGIPFISAINLDGRTVVEDDKLLCMTEEQYEKLGSGKLQKGDIVVCIRGSLGKHGVYLFEKGAIASSLVILRSSFTHKSIDDFLMLYLDSPVFSSEIKKYDNGTAQPNLSAKSLEQFLFPLPPLAEQKRIVAKIEEFLPLVDHYEQAWTKLESFNRRFSEDMKKSILQQAIQGKLVEQRLEEGTAQELYAQIQAEKQRLIKEGKLKKEKPLPEITEDEKPFEIPEGWMWVRLGDIAHITGGYAFKSTCFSEKGIRVIRISDFNEKGFINAKVVRHPYQKFLSPFLLEEKNILLCMTGGTVGKSYFVTKLEEPMVTNQRVATIKVLFAVEEYINFVISSAMTQKTIHASKNSTNDNISMETINCFLVPFPPLAEQKRIVDRLEKLLPLCEKLK